MRRSESESSAAIAAALSAGWSARLARGCALCGILLANLCLPAHGHAQSASHSLQPAVSVGGNPQGSGGDQGFSEASNCMKPKRRRRKSAVW